MADLNILWIDDDHEDFSSLKGRAKVKFGLKLRGFKSVTSGLTELERNYNFYDGIILDARILENDNDDPDTAHTKFVHRAKERIVQLPKKFEIFVLTGQAKAYADESFNEAFTKVYSKGNVEDQDRLLRDVKAAAESQADMQLRFKHQKVFEVCTEKYIGETAGQDLLSLLKIEDEKGTEVFFPQIRKIIEDLLRAFNKFGLLPDEFVTPNVAHNPSSMFLSGKSQDNRTTEYLKAHRHLKSTWLPKTVAIELENILKIVQDGAHRSNIDAHVKTLCTPYLFQSVLYQLLDVLVWFKAYIDSSPPKHNWEKIEKDNKDHIEITKITDWEHGEIIKISDNGYGTFKPDRNIETISVRPEIISDCKLVEGCRIRATIKPSPNGRKMFIDKLEREESASI